MKKVERYESIDGILFESESDCAEHDVVCEVCEYLSGSNIHLDECSFEEIVNIIIQRYNITPKRLETFEPRKKGITKRC